MPFENAVRESVAWMRARNGAIPEEALDGAAFEVGGGGDAPAQAVNLDFEGGRIWAASLDYPDGEVVGRTWVTEITVGEQEGSVHFGTRLVNVTKRADPPFMPTLPALTRQLINRLSAHADSLELTESSFRIDTPDEVDDLIALLDDPKRRLPVLVIADGSAGTQFASPDAVAKRVAGACHVVSLSTTGSRELIQRIGKPLSVFDGAARFYRPLFRSDRSDPFEHPRWIARQGTSPAGRRDMLVARVLSAAVNTGHQEDYPRFNVVRQAAAAQLIDTKRLTGTSEDLKQLFEEENTRLSRELKNLKSEFDQWLDDADETTRAAEREMEALRSELSRARAQNDILRASLVSGIPVGREKLAAAEQFGEWIRSNLSTNIWISPKAVREFEKSCTFKNIEIIGETLFMLDDLYISMRRSPSDEAFSRFRIRLSELGLEDKPCFKNKNDIKNFPEYRVSYQANLYWCDQHIKYGGGTDPRNMFRIYYHWNEIENILLIGHLPGHLDNHLTN